MRFATIVVAMGTLTLASCQTPAHDRQLPLPRVPSAEPDGQHLAEALCSGCHAIAEGEISPNPEAPEFVSIANREGLSRATLGDFLHDSYNFPNQMNLELSDEDADAIAAYILTMRKD